MKKPKIKLVFCLKSKKELDRLTHEELLKYVKDLQDNVVQEKPPKNSSNSGIAPSSEIAPPDKNKKNQSLREKSGKKSGGQKGHKGRTLEQF